MIIGRKRLQLILSFVVALAALVILATGLSDLELKPGDPTTIRNVQTEQSTGVDEIQQPPPRALPWDIPWDLVITTATVVFMIASTIYLIRSREGRRGVLRYVVSLLWVMSSVFLLIHFARLTNLELNFSIPGFDPQQGPPVPYVDFIANPPQWFSFFIGLVVFLALGGYLLTSWRRKSRQADDAVEQLLERAQGTIEALRSGYDFEDAVRRCYFEMSQILDQKSGIRRQQAMTPGEFAQKLETLGLPGEYVRRLTGLFEAVRYGAKPVGKREEEEAVACLTAIVETLGAA